MQPLVCRGLTRPPLFDGLDLTVEEGEIVVLSGPTGSGKSLLLRAIADLDPLEGGEVVLDGEPRTAVEPARWRSEVLYVHQSGVRLTGTVRENLEAIERLAIRRGGPGTPFPSVPGLLDEQDAERLSGGEAQALALHRALCCRPRVLLLDEATSAMDPKRAAAWEARIQAFAGAGGAILWVSHDTTLAPRLGARQERLG